MLCTINRCHCCCSELRQPEIVEVEALKVIVLLKSSTGGIVVEGKGDGHPGEGHSVTLRPMSASTTKPMSPEMPLQNKCQNTLKCHVTTAIKVITMDPTRKMCLKCHYFY